MKKPTQTKSSNKSTDTIKKSPRKKLEQSIPSVKPVKKNTALSKKKLDHKADIDSENVSETVDKVKKENEQFFVEPNLPTHIEMHKEQQELIDKISNNIPDYEEFKNKNNEQIEQKKQILEYDFKTLEKSEKLVLSIDKLFKCFGKKNAVNGVSFDIHTGEVVGFLGPNGAGKTTVFYMIVGILSPDSGSILFNGVSMERFPMYKRARLGISYLPQEPSVFRRLTVEKNIIAVLQTIRGMKKQDMKNRLDKIISEFGLTECRKQNAFTLSGGERRRTEIARGMALHPYFLLLDEPFTGIDPKARYELKQIISSLSKKGIGVLITDHNERDTLSITDRAFILHEGLIVASGSRTDIMNNIKAREIYLGEEYD